MKEKKGCVMIHGKKFFLLCWIVICAVLLAGALIAPGGGAEETIQETMRDAVLHEANQINLFGLCLVNPGYISSLVVTVVLLVAALLIRVFVIPRISMCLENFN